MKVLGTNLIRKSVCRSQRPLRKLVRQLELAHRDLDLHPGIGVMPQHFGHAADRLRVAAGLRDQVDRHHLAGLGAAHLGRRHDDVVRDAAVLGHEEQHAVPGVEPADDAAIAALEHFDDRALRAAARVAAAHANRGAVAVNDLAHLRGRQEHARAAVIGLEKAVAIGMALDAAGEQGDALRDQQGSGPVLHHFARALECGKRGLESPALASLDLEARSELLRGERRAGAVQGIENFVAVAIARHAALGARAPAQCGFHGLFL